MRRTVTIGGLLLAVFILMSACSEVNDAPRVWIATVTPNPAERTATQVANQATATASAIAPTQTLQAAQTATAALSTQTARAEEEAQVQTVVARTATAISLNATQVSVNAFATILAENQRQEESKQVINDALLFMAAGVALVSCMFLGLLIMVRANEGGIRRNQAEAARAEQERQVLTARAQADEAARMRLEAETRMREAQIRHEAVEKYRQEALKQRIQSEAYLHEVEIERLQAEARLIAIRAEAGLRGKANGSNGNGNGSNGSGGGNGFNKDDNLGRSPDQGKDPDMQNLPLAG